MNDKALRDLIAKWRDRMAPGAQAAQRYADELEAALSSQPEQATITTVPSARSTTCGPTYDPLATSVPMAPAPAAEAGTPREVLEKCASYILRDVTMGWTRKRDDVIKEIVDLAAGQAAKGRRK